MINPTSCLPAVRTRLTKLLKCRYPLVLPGMSWISTPPLVSSVSNAGGCGILATGPLSPDETRASIREIRSRLHRDTSSSKHKDDTSPLPFGVGITLLMPGALENAHVACLEEQVPVVNLSLGRPPSYLVDAVHSYGGVVVSTVTTPVHAEAALNAGADALLVTGHEAAAHGAPDRGSLVLVPELSALFPDTPIVAAGGWANGRGVLAALSLGADGVAMGTRFAVTTESALAENVKLALARPDTTETLFGDAFDGIPARVLKTGVSAQAMTRRPWFGTVAYRALRAARTMGVPLYQVLPGLLTQWDKMYMVAQFGAATDALQAATVEGDLQQKGVQFAGQCVGLIQDVPSVDELVQRIVTEMEEAHSRNDVVFQNEHSDDSVHFEVGRTSSSG